MTVCSVKTFFVAVSEHLTRDHCLSSVYTGVGVPVSAKKVVAPGGGCGTPRAQPPPRQAPPPPLAASTTAAARSWQAAQSGLRAPPCQTLSPKTPVTNATLHELQLAAPDGCSGCESAHSWQHQMAVWDADLRVPLQEE